MSLLPYDITRCMGQGNGRIICRKRNDCQRYVDRGQPGQQISMAAMLCRDSDFECRIPVEREGKA